MLTLNLSRASINTEETCTDNRGLEGPCRSLHRQHAQHECVDIAYALIVRGPKQPRARWAMVFISRHFSEMTSRKYFLAPETIKKIDRLTKTYRLKAASFPSRIIMCWQWPVRKCLITGQMSDKLISFWSVFRTFDQCLISAWSQSDHTLIRPVRPFCMGVSSWFFWNAEK